MTKSVFKGGIEYFITAVGILLPLAGFIFLITYGLDLDWSKILKEYQTLLTGVFTVLGVILTAIITVNMHKQRMELDRKKDVIFKFIEASATHRSNIISAILNKNMDPLLDSAIRLVECTDTIFTVFSDEIRARVEIKHRELVIKMLDIGKYQDKSVST
ncbi:hypothetical protein [uncultured Shewanella sp.]|uniref:hypothetical protein n=1 Tax=uncultured Shewanella sp. TaxID=173975 RepID=UPI0026254F0F|nr:hypothetical protein [uncultured Shewanella sp.]